MRRIRRYFQWSWNEWLPGPRWIIAVNAAAVGVASNPKEDAMTTPDWQPPELPDDDRARMYRVYGYRDTGDPRAPLGESLGQVGVGTTNKVDAIALRDEWAAKRPDDRWVVEWSLI